MKINKTGQTYAIFVANTIMKFVRGLCLVFHFFFYLLLVSLFGPIWFFLYRNNKKVMGSLMGTFTQTVTITVKRTSLSSSSRVNSFFFTTFSWFLKLNSAAFFWSLANLFSYLETFFNVGLTLKQLRGHVVNRIGKKTKYNEQYVNTYNFPRKSFTWLFNSLI